MKEKAAEIKTQMGLPEESDLWQVLEQLPQEQLDAHERFSDREK